jgi:hypothetical protein
MTEKKEKCEDRKWRFRGNQSRILKERQHNGKRKWSKRQTMTPFANTTCE